MCGLVGVFNVPEAGKVAAHALQRVQHRGEDAAGVVSSDGRDLYRHRNPGSVATVFGSVDLSVELPGNSAIGHTRYATAGKGGIARRERGSKRGIQPLIDDSRILPSAYAHNGTIPDSERICIELEREGASFASRSDTEIILHLTKRSKQTVFRDRLIDAFEQIDGAYALLVLTPDRLYAARDPYGFRPLRWAPYQGGAVVVSESCVLDLLGIDRSTSVEIEPGTLLEFIPGRAEPEIIRFASAECGRFCSFEWIYFARPDTNFGGVSVSITRENLGRRLAKRFPAPGADLVMPIPDSAISHARGFAAESGLPFNMGLVRSHAVGRTFIDSEGDRRANIVRLKLNPIHEILEGKEIVVVDDSIVRGTTTREILKALRKAGARKIHLRIASPPVIGPCFWGIDTPTREELIATRLTIDRIRDFVGADTLEYLPIEDLREVLGDPKGCRHCFSCFTGKHPTKP